MILSLRNLHPKKTNHKIQLPHLKLAVLFKIKYNRNQIYKAVILLTDLTIVILVISLKLQVKLTLYCIMIYNNNRELVINHQSLNKAIYQNIKRQSLKRI